MRLLHSRTLEFKEFFNQESTPPYAILSHTWGDEEITFKDMRKYLKSVKMAETQRSVVEGGMLADCGHTIIERMSGFKKIRYCAEQATMDNLDYFWIDTCCIDKSSSAELSEAINSMFRWYRDSAVCYAYLSDLADPLNAIVVTDVNSMARAMNKELAKSVWFTRGWTLQELIAPRKLIFYTASWTEVAEKNNWYLRRRIEKQTGIPVPVLLTGDSSRCSLAQRMSWASSRRTTRLEDGAYCLLGIFEVHMPLLYGEGEHAFLRLQEEVIRQSDDLSIFAWKDSQAAETYMYRGLLARSASEFAHCGGLLWDRISINQTLEVGSKEITIDAELRPLINRPDEYLALLPGVGGHDWGDWLGIFLQKITHNHFVRVQTGRVEDFRAAGFSDAYLQERTGKSTFSSSRVCVRNNPVLSRNSFAEARKIVLAGVRTRPSDGEELRDFQIWPRERWDEKSLTFSFGDYEQQDTSQAQPTGKFSFDFGAHSTPVIITFDRTKEIDTCLAVSKPWCFCDVSKRYNGTLLKFEERGLQQKLKIELALVLKRDRCVLDMTVSLSRA